VFDSILLIFYNCYTNQYSCVWRTAIVYKAADANCNFVCVCLQDSLYPYERYNLVICKAEKDLCNFYKYNSSWTQTKQLNVQHTL
jgi:hypothetical protein